jgi:hypothetical protein
MQSRLSAQNEQINTLNRENNFFNQSTTVFMTVKKVMETERELLLKMALTQNEEKRAKLKYAIH